MLYASRAASARERIHRKSMSKFKKVKLKGNESFNFREGWLRKGMRCVGECETLFSQDDVMERLGVGSKMVKSIRYWLQATDLCKEVYVNNGRTRAQVMTDEFGRVINEYDPYFDDIFTLFLIHWHIVSNESLCIAWNIFFNEFEGQDFTRENMIANCRELLIRKLDAGCEFSERSFEDDCLSVIRMYAEPENDEDPEESLKCPLTALGLLQKNSKNTFTRSAPALDSLDKLVILYVITKNLPDGKNSVSINDLLNAPDNIGRVFNLSRVMINNYLDQLRVGNYLTVNRTAGLDMVYIDPIMRPSDIMIEYYRMAQER